MTLAMIKTLSMVALIGCFLSMDIIDKAYITLDEARTYPGFSMQSEYSGSLSLRNGKKASDMSLQVAIYGNNRFRAVLYYGGLPGDGPDPVSENDIIELEGSYEDHTLRVDGDFPLHFQFNHNLITALDKQNNYMGHFKRVHRKSPTLGMAPPENAIVLFDGTHLDYWDENTEMTEDGLLKEGAKTKDHYKDMRLHVEAKLAFIPYTRRGLTNSGIYIQNRYEVQILDSYTLTPTISGNASLYNEIAPRVNASYPPLTWQTYDVFFRAPRFDEDGNKVENARFTVYLNGVLEHYNVELEGGTGAGGRRSEVPAAELYLQDHRDPVRFRNIWLVEGVSTPPPVKILQPGSEDL